MDIDPTLRFESILVSLTQLRVWLGEREIHFTLSELRLLLVFLQEPYRTFSRDELIRRADLTSLDALHQLISRLRSLLGQQYIFTATAGAGYSFARHGRLSTVTAVTPTTTRGHHAKTI